MLPRTKNMPKPTDGELEILSVLWNKGPSTVRDIHEVLAKQREIGRTTVLKLVQIMTEKGLVAKDESVRPNLFTAAPTQSSTRDHLVDDLLVKAFGGSAEKLVLHVLGGKKARPEELDAIREMLDRMEKEG